VQNLINAASEGKEDEIILVSVGFPNCSKPMLS
jgi:hypothetical protein